MKQLRPYQSATVERTRESIARGHQRVVISLPTGSGKTVIASELVKGAVAKGKGAQIYTNRRVLIDQIADTLGVQGISHGVLAAGYPVTMIPSVQVASIQTIHSRAIKQDKWRLPDGGLTIIDEAHSNTGKMAGEIIERHALNDSVIVGLTATPVGLGEMYEDIVIGANYGQLVREGHLVGVDIYAPNEPNLKGVRMRKGEYIQGDVAKVVSETIVHAKIVPHWIELNPSRIPTLAFVPSVAESRWLMEEFNKNGIKAEHIDGSTPSAERESLFVRHQAGEFTVLCSCGVLREGFDAPWVGHIVLVQPCGGVSTFLQIVGRGMRPFDGKDRLILQDHAGAWHRHGRPDSDRHWVLDDDNVRQHKERQAEKEKAGDDEAFEGFACGQCGFIRMGGNRCPVCGHLSGRSARKIIEQDGRLHFVHGPAEPVKKKKARTDDDHWKTCMFIGARTHKTVAQCKWIFKQKTGHWPPDRLTTQMYDKDRIYHAVPWLEAWMHKHGIDPRPAVGAKA